LNTALDSEFVRVKREKQDSRRHLLLVALVFGALIVGGFFDGWPFP
jgi:hypothetical protein